MWQKVAAGAVLGAAATKLLLSTRADAPNSSRSNYTAPSVTFAADALRKPESEADGAALLPAAAAAMAGGTQQQAGSWRQWRWVVEAQLLALQVVLAAVATVTADRLHGRSLAVHVLLASAFLIGGLALVSVIAAGVSAALQAWQQPRMQQWGPTRAMRAAALGEALLAEMGGLKVAAAEAAPSMAQNFSGTWEKDRTASDSLDPAISAMRLNILLRRAVTLVRGLEIKQDDQEFEMAVFSVVPWFKVIERYPLNGEDRQFKRRDLRRGKHVGHAEVLPDGRIRLHVAWKDPIGGHGHDTFSSPAAGVLHVDTLMNTHEQTLEYRTIYHRRQH